MCCCDPYATEQPICCQCCDPYAGGGGDEVTLVVPAGSSHDFWLGTRTGVTDMRAQADTDFDVSTSFDLAPAADTVHGLLVGDSDLLGVGQFIRFDVYNAGSVMLFAANDTGSIFHNAPWPVGDNHLRIKRSGNDFDCYSSPDGVAWSLVAAIPYIMTVSQVGLWAGNFNSNPAHTVTFSNQL